MTIGTAFKLLFGVEFEFNFSQYRRNAESLRKLGRPDYSGYNPPDIPDNLPVPY